MKRDKAKPLRNLRVAITRPAGTGAAMTRRVRASGGDAFSLPGSSLRAAEDPEAARRVLRAALACEIVVFTSAAAVRFAAKLSSLRCQARIVAPGSGTAAALRRAGLGDVLLPARADSEGLLAMPPLRHLRGRRVAIVGAPGGRDLLQRGLGARGARVTRAHVYRRVPARLDRRHIDPLMHGRWPLYVLLSSDEALRHLLQQLPASARSRLLAGSAIVSSSRLERAARQAGFAHVLRAASAQATDLVAALMAARSG